MRRAKLFRNGSSQAVRLPKEFRFPGDEVLIKQEGKAVVLLPQEDYWDSLLRSLDRFTSDFMEDRGQPLEAEARNPFA
ncbi:MAG: type II toxin-antitoxin system VapB family antitoxin [Thermaerobacter sp.]|nr:type II toxin-antitoxin system VapB family antitoxin [Thermaerobacter sp.]